MKQFNSNEQRKKAARSFLGAALTVPFAADQFFIVNLSAIAEGRDESDTSFFIDDSLPADPEGTVARLYFPIFRTRLVSSPWQRMSNSSGICCASINQIRHRKNCGSRGVQNVFKDVRNGDGPGVRLSRITDERVSSEDVFVLAHAQSGGNVLGRETTSVQLESRGDFYYRKWLRS
jgi:hypothetical protein